MSQEREQWGSRWGFVIAAIGSAIGLGNIWRYPYVAYKSGGGAFLIPYLFAIITTGISFVAFEFILGKKYRGSPPLTYSRINKKLEFLGWWQFLIPFFIMTYYAVILAWAFNYIGYSLTLAWGEDTNAFFFESFLNISSEVSVSGLGGIVWQVFIPLMLVWFVTLSIVYRGIKSGIEKMNKIAMPTLAILFLIFVIRAVTLRGAVTGLNAFFQPNWSSLAKPDVWIAAYSQIFYSLSLAMGIMITYSSYLPKKVDTNTSAFVTAFANSGFELLAGIGIFAAMGFMAVSTNTQLENLVTSGVGLAFVVLPQIINQLPLSQFFGSVFFICLFLAGITSLISLMEVCVSTASEKFAWSRQRTVVVIGILVVLFSIGYTTNGGLYLLDVVDNFINNFAILPGALVEILLVCWVFKKFKELQAEANKHSYIQLGKTWRLTLGIITPLALAVILGRSLVDNIKTVYGGYPQSFVGIFGWGLVIALPIVSALLANVPWKNPEVAQEIPSGEDDFAQ